MKKTILISILAAMAAWGQQTKQEESKPPAPFVPFVQKILEIKHADVYRVANLIGVLGATVKADPTMRVIAVNGPKETVAAIEEAVKRLDQPTPTSNVELTVYMVYASTKGEAGSEPAELAPAIKQLRSIFAYKGYRVVETLILRGRDGQGGVTNGYVLWPAGGGPGPAGGDSPRRVRYSLEYRTASLTSTPGSRIVRLDDLTLNLPDMNSHIRTNVDVREGQKVVVGKSNVTGSADDALIMVVTAKVVE